jgi:hypothetical protein
MMGDRRLKKKLSGFAGKNGYQRREAMRNEAARQSWVKVARAWLRSLGEHLTGWAVPGFPRPNSNAK